MFKNAWNFVKNHKKGFITGGVIAILGTVAAVAIGTGKEDDEPTMIENVECEVNDAVEEAAQDMDEKIENSENE